MWAYKSLCVHVCDVEEHVRFQYLTIHKSTYEHNTNHTHTHTFSYNKHFFLCIDPRQYHIVQMETALDGNMRAIP